MNSTLLREVLEEKHILSGEREVAQNDALSMLLQDTEYKEIYTLLKGAQFDLARAQAYGEDTSSLDKSISTLKERLAKRTSLLGISQDIPYTCDKCKDTGYTNGHICSCVRLEVIRRQKSLITIPNLSSHTFDKLKADYFNGHKQEKAMASLYKAMRTYCDKFPNVLAQNILLMGEAGVGKSCLVDCMANALMDRGLDVCYMTAFEMNNNLRSYHTTFTSDKDKYLSDLISSEILIIDDLGTEPIYRNVTIEYLLSILTERKRNGLHTIISTNLNESGIVAKYGERIASRLFDKDITFFKKITGDDMRYNR